MFTYQDGVVRPIVFQGQTMPGSGLGGPDQTLSRLDFSDSLQANDEGAIAFIANTTPNSAGGDSGVFIKEGDELRSVVFEGLLAPGSGVEPGEADLPFTSFSSLSLNERGEMVFTATFEQNSAGGGRGVFWSNGEIVKPILVEGDSFTDADGVLRTTIPGRLPGVSFQGNVFGSTTSGLNDRGEIGLLVNYGRGQQGVFVATIIPEPSALTLLTLCAGACYVNRRKAAIVRVGSGLQPAVRGL